MSITANTNTCVSTPVTSDSATAYIRKGSTFSVRQRCLPAASASMRTASATGARVSGRRNQISAAISAASTAVKRAGERMPAEAASAAAKAGPITVPTLKPEDRKAISLWRSALLVRSAT